MKRHILVSGTGRSGTTFLMQLLTALRLDTGFDSNTDKIDEISNAGMEWDLRDQNAPFIVKSPWICEYLATVMIEGSLCVEHIIIPVRDLYDAAESRRDVMRRAANKKKGSPNRRTRWFVGNLGP